jgi:glycosyltransferase involved in cell wall biosynthesis
MKPQAKNIELLIATGLYPPDIGGPATYARMLEEKLPAHGFTVTIVAFTSVRHLPKVVRHSVFAWKLLWASRGKDVVYALDPISVGIPARIVASVMGKPFIIRLGGDYAWEQGQQRFGVEANLDAYTINPKAAPWQVRVLAFLQTTIVKSALFVVLPSEYLKSIVVTWGVSAERIRVMYSSLHPLEVSASKENLRAELGHKGQVITSVGRLVPWKGFLGLIEAFAMLKGDLPETTLRIIGDGPQLEELRRKAAELGVSDRVALVGKLDKAALGKEIKASDLFVLNTEYEGLSHQLLEVMDLGVPIVTTRVGGNPELITDAISGILIEVGDTVGLGKAMKHVLLNEGTQLRLTQNARLRTQDFSQDAVVLKVANFLKSEVVTP